MTDLINEGMRGGDLEDMVLPMITVDEYTSKMDETAVVFGFFVNSLDAAKDLNRFIQKSPVPLLDSEVSPAPDQNGYYIVFFEILNDERIAENVREVLDEVEPLTKNTAWQLRIRGVDRLVPFSVSALTVHLKNKNEDGGEKQQAPIQEQVLAFLQPSGLSGTSATGSRLIIEGRGNRIEFEIVDFGPTEKLLAENDLGALGMSLKDAAQELRLALMLGDGWSVHRVGPNSVLLHEWSEDALLVKHSI